MRILDLRGAQLSLKEVAELAPRAALDISEAAIQIQPLIEDVRQFGADAVIRATEKFDGFTPSSLLVSQDEIDAAVRGLDAALRTAIETAIERVRAVCNDSLAHPSETHFEAGGKVSQRFVPVEAVGLYVPGGRAVYPSSVVMNVVPAQVAGVKRLVIATPGQKEFGGRPHPTVLAVAGLLGVSNILVAGGAAAIASFAFGLKQIGLEPVDLVTGPGNIYVAAAKRLLRGQVGIDTEAGTTEILILADSSANAKFVANDLVSQAEHDDAAAAVLVTDSEQLIGDVQEELKTLSIETTHVERVQKALGGQQSALVLVDDLDAAINFANGYAAEHLELMTAQNQNVLGKIVHAGAIFVGDYSPVSLGDYMAGSNHVLPTGGSARFNAGLSVATFLRPQQVIEYSRGALEVLAAQIDTFAKAEGLPAHGDAVTARFSS
jgi:histidinol dehydrogenase